MGSAISPRPWNVSTPCMSRSARPGIRRRSVRLEDLVAVGGAHGDRLEAVLAPDHDHEVLAHRPAPEPGVELLVGGALLAAHAHDHVAAAKAGAAGGADRGHADDDEAA